MGIACKASSKARWEEKWWAGNKEQWGIVTMNNAGHITIRSAAGLYYPARLSNPSCEVDVAEKAQKEIFDLEITLI